MYLCILDPQEEVLLHRNPRACLEAFLKAIERYCRDLVVAGGKLERSNIQYRLPT